MKTNVVIFGGLGAFCIVVGFIYGFVTGFDELAGFPLLLLTGGMGFMLWFYLRSTQRRHEVLDGDRIDGEISDMAGNYGRFYPWSWWPLGLGFSLAFLFFGLAIDWWVMLLALIPGVYFITGWVMEGNRKNYAH